MIKYLVLSLIIYTVVHFIRKQAVLGSVNQSAKQLPDEDVDYEEVTK